MCEYDVSVNEFSGSMDASYYDAYASYYDAVASYYDADMYDVSYYLFGSYLSDETMNVENVHVSETNSKVGNTVTCLVMSSSVSGSLSDETINAEGDRDHHHGRRP